MLRRLRRHPLVARFPEKAFVYDERDFPSYTLPGLYAGAGRTWSARVPVMGSPYVHRPNPAPASPDVAPELLFSFRGSITHRSRVALRQLRHPRAIVDIVPPGGPRSGASVAGRDGQAYFELMRASKFVLCPRGHGASSFRLYEALAIGRVPVIVSDDWLPPPRIAWHACSVRIKERDVKAIPHVLDRLEPSWPSMSASARQAALALSDDRLWDYFGTSLETLARRRRSVLQYIGIPERSLWLHGRRWRSRLARSHG